MPQILNTSSAYVGTNAVSRMYYNGSIVWPTTSLRITSKNNTTAGGFTVGAAVTKDMASATRPLTTNIAYPGTTAPPAATAQRWADWLGDIFDNWGWFYLYNPATDTYYSPILSPVNAADGTITTQTFSAFGRTFTIKHGYPVQGIFKFDISVADSLPFYFGAYGDMGSDTATTNTDLTQSYTLNGTTYTLYYNRNIQTGSATEIFFSYVIPYETDINNTITYNRRSSGPGVQGGSQEILSIYTKSVKYGVTLYFAKTNDVKNWVINDLQVVSA